MQRPLREEASHLVRRNLRLARSKWGKHLGVALEQALAAWSEELRISIESGDLLLIEAKWYVTHSGLLRLARRKKCCGIHVDMTPEFCDPRSSRWTCRAPFTSPQLVKASSVTAMLIHQMLILGPRRRNEGRGDPRGEPRSAQGVRNRHLLGRRDRFLRGASRVVDREAKKLPPQPANGNYGSPKVRDRLCQLIRQHQLDANLVKSYATDFCGVKALRDATREQVENFVVRLADRAEKDRDALLCQLNSYVIKKEGVA